MPPDQSRLAASASSPGFRRRGAGLACSLLCHALFVGLMVVKLTPPRVILAETAEPAATYASLYRNPPSPTHSPAGTAPGGETAARKAVAAPPSPQPEPPAPRELPKLAPKPRPTMDTAIEPAAPQALTPDLQAEAKPLHAPLAAAATDSEAPPPSALAEAACQLGAQIQAELQDSPAVLTAIASLPHRDRSVANALMLWQGSWIGAGPLGDTPERIVQAALKSAVLSASDGCRSQIMRGPQFIAVMTGADTTVLVVGSGEWRWGDLLR